jgi:hypothetical protein
MSALFLNGLLVVEPASRICAGLLLLVAAAAAVQEFFIDKYVQFSLQER